MESFSVIAWLIGALRLPASWGTDYLHVTTALVVLTLLSLISLFAWRRLRATSRRLVPEERASLANVFELLVEHLLRMMEEAMGPRGRRHLPLLGTLFFYLLACNLMGAIPGFSPPTDNINTNLACALVVFVYYNAVGIREQGLKRYAQHMAGPIAWIAPFMLAMEVISHIVRPVSLSVRLLGNMVGDHLVLGIFQHLTPLVIPMVFEVLAIFIAFIQAFVFTMLSLVYIALASAGEEPHHESSQGG